MQKRMLPAALAAALLCTGGAALAQTAPTQSSRTTTTTTTTSVGTSGAALSESEIEASVANAGYKKVKGLKFQDGVWQARARGGNDRWTHIKIGPTTGKVYQANAPSMLNKDEVKAKLTAQGYQNIGDVEFDDGLWSARARNPEGKKVGLLVDPNDGSIVAIKQD